MKQSFHKNQVGFTLVELLIVIAIIGIMSTVTVVSLRVAKAKARDAVRIADITQIKKAIDTYYGYYGTYPNPNCFSLSGIVACTSLLNDGRWISDLVDAEDDFFEYVPNDPFRTFEAQPVESTQASQMYLYMYTHKGSEPPKHKDYYYLYYHLETDRRIDCPAVYWPYSGGDWDTKWSVICAGNLP